jgi:hypothetical protein
MVNQNLKLNQNLYYVVHPLDDVPEVKCNVDELGPMPMTRSVRWSLFALRGYLILMGVLVAFQVFAMAAHHIAR